MIIDSDFLNRQDMLATHLILGQDNFSWNMYSKTAEYSVASKNQIVPIDDRQEDGPQFVHSLAVNNENVSEYWNFSKIIFDQFCEKHSINYSTILRAKYNLTFKNSENYIRPAHVDFDFSHKVFIYYVEDSDGDTIIFNERYPYAPEDNSLTIKETVSPSMGRAVLFDGLLYHSPQTPKNSERRTVLNIAFV